MTIERFKALVLQLANSMFVRYYLCLNYPNDWKRMGIQFVEPITGTRLADSLRDRGFEYNLRLGIWTIERLEAPEP